MALRANSTAPKGVAWGDEQVSTSTCIMSATACMPAAPGLSTKGHVKLAELPTGFGQPLEGLSGHVPALFQPQNSPRR